MKKCVFGIIKSEGQAQRVVDQLQSAGFSGDDISILLPSHTRTRGRTTNGGFSDPSVDTMTYKRGTVSHEKHTKAPEGGATGALAGGIIGGSIGLLAGIGSLAIPGLGFFVAAGPILAALSGSAIGGSVGLLVGWLAGLGIPEYEAKKYENSLKEGNILICVHSETSELATQATNVLRRENVKDISSTTEKTARR